MSYSQTYQQSYYQQPQPYYQQSYYYQPPPPPPVDPHTFRRDYAARLADLNVNSRPIIQSLSMFAQDYTRFADIVVQCIETHIRRVPPHMKLHAFYLIDAISKNVSDPYSRHFAAVVVPLFLDTYHEVDDSTRSKMEEMLLTWRTGSPSGIELFGVPCQIAIERGVWGDGSSLSSFDSGPSGSGYISRARVLRELEYVLGQKERTLQANPYDTTSRNHLQVLHQLRGLVENGVSQQELHQIVNQLRSLAQANSSPPTPVQRPTQPAPPSRSWQPSSYPTSSAPAYSTPLPSGAPVSTPPPQSFPSKNESAPAAPPPSSTSNLNPPVDISNILATLVKSGVVAAAVPSSQTALDAQNKPEDVDLEKESSRAYRNLILSRPIKMTSAEITKNKPQIIELLYNRLSSQCKQCGMRFADSIIGKKEFEDHLDVHFRQNRKAGQNVGRGHSRSWFVALDDWIHDISASHKGKGRGEDGRRLNPKEAAAAEAAKRDSELRAQYVVVPPGDEAKPISCPICKESMTAEFLEDDEEWVWRNAVMKDSKVYHATCHAEALASTNSLAARLRSELAGRSRSRTPEVQNASSRSTPPLSSSSLRVKKSESPVPESNLLGLKRKAETDETDLNGEVNLTPPFKKAALELLAT